MKLYFKQPFWMLLLITVFSDALAMSPPINEHGNPTSKIIPCEDNKYWNNYIGAYSDFKDIFVEAGIVTNRLCVHSGPVTQNSPTYGGEVSPSSALLKFGYINRLASFLYVGLHPMIYAGRIRSENVVGAEVRVIAIFGLFKVGIRSGDEVSNVYFKVGLGF